MQNKKKQKSGINFYLALAVIILILGFGKYNLISQDGQATGFLSYGPATPGEQMTAEEYNAKYGGNMPSFPSFTQATPSFQPPTAPQVEQPAVETPQSYTPRLQPNTQPQQPSRRVSNTLPNPHYTASPATPPPQLQTLQEQQQEAVPRVPENIYPGQADNICHNLENAAVCEQFQQCRWNGYDCLLRVKRHHAAEENVQVDPVPVNFALAAHSVGTSSVRQGSSVSYNVNIKILSGSLSSLRLGVTGLPAGATSSIVQSGALYTVMVVVQTSFDTPVGSYAVTISGTDGNIVRSTSVSLMVIPVAGRSGTY